MALVVVFTSETSNKSVYILFQPLLGEILYDQRDPTVISRVSITFERE